MKKSIFSKTLACVLSVFLYVFISVLSAIGVSAADGVLSLVSKADDTVISGVIWQIYAIGEYSDDKITLNDDFAGCKVSFGDNTASELQQAAGVLSEYAVKSGVKPLFEGVSDENGVTKFNSISKGLYLAVGTELTIDSSKYIPSPMLINLDASSGTYESYAKFEVEKVPEEVLVKYSVEKTWKGDEKTSTRPSSVDIEILKDNVLWKTVTLNDANNWRYTWSDKADIKWEVKEKFVPQNYFVDYFVNGTDYTVQNTYISPVETPTKSKGEKPTPNTGTTWFVISVAQLSALAVFAVASRFRKNKTKNND